MAGSDGTNDNYYWTIYATESFIFSGLLLNSYLEFYCWGCSSVNYLSILWSAQHQSVTLIAALRFPAAMSSRSGGDLMADWMSQRPYLRWLQQLNLQEFSDIQHKTQTTCISAFWRHTTQIRGHPGLTVQLTERGVQERSVLGHGGNGGSHARHRGRCEAGNEASEQPRINGRVLSIQKTASNTRKPKDNKPSMCMLCWRDRFRQRRKWCPFFWETSPRWCSGLKGLPEEDSEVEAV